MFIAPMNASPAYLYPQCFGLRRADFTAAGPDTYESKPIEAKPGWTNAIASWNIAEPQGVSFELDLRANVGGSWTKWYRMGTWSIEGQAAPRTSIGDQGDDNGTVDTDTLLLKQPAEAIQVKIITNRIDSLKLATVSLSNPSEPILEPAPDKKVWGTVLPVFKRYQDRYPNGGVVCSATSTSMLLRYWADSMKRPALDHDVPAVAAAVYDTAWKGTGNWAFNMAFPGSFDGMESYVTRLSSVADLEKWIAAGIPVATSVSYNMLRGRPKNGADDGHLVVLIGFDGDGNPIFNDPADNHHVNTTFKRSDFEKGWADSGRTVYLVYPVGTLVPVPEHGEWLPFSP